jgi:SRSO17 transposase
MARWPAPVGGRLYLPQSWLEDPARCAQAGGCRPEVGFATKPQIALALIEEALADEVAPAPVLADAAYGNGFACRQRLRQLDLEFFLQVTPQEHHGWTEAVPTVCNGNYRTVDQATAQSARPLLEIARALPAEAWQPCRWRAANGKPQRTRLAWQEVFLARGLKEPQGQLEKLWLVVDWPQDAPAAYHCYLAHLNRAPSKARCLKLSRSRWHVEHYFQPSKDDLGFEHYEGRFWRGFHHHLVLSAIAYLFILTIYLGSKKVLGSSWETILAAIRPWLLRSTGSCPFCRATFPDEIDDST